MRLFSRRDLKMLARLAVGSHPLPYHFMRLAPKRSGFATNREKMVHEDTDICIDGFPHSGNTFFTRLVSYWNPDLKIARHMHVPAQIEKAVAAGIPTLVLIRPPEQALVSILFRYPDLNPQIACSYYSIFYCKLMSCEHRFIVADFDHMIQDPVFYLKLANKKFDIDIKYTEFDEDVEKRIIKMVPKKIEKRKSPEDTDWRDQISKQLVTLPRFKQARSMYQRFCRSITI